MKIYYYFLHKNLWKHVNMVVSVEAHFLTVLPMSFAHYQPRCLGKIADAFLCLSAPICKMEFITECTFWVIVAGQ